jgi:hypothetical protein
MVCPKGFLFWPLIGIEKVGMQSFDPSGYSVGSHLYISYFDIFYGIRSSDPWLVQCRLPFISDLSIHGQLSPSDDMTTENILICLLFIFVR